MMKKNNIFRVYVKLFAKLFRKAPLDFSSLLFFNLVDGIGYGIIIIFQKQFYDVASMFAQGNETLNVVIYALAILGIFKLLSPMLGSICRMSLAFFTEKMNGINQKEIYQKLSRLEPIVFEDTKVLDNINKASQGMQATVGFVVTISRIFVNHIPYFIIVGVFLFAQRPILVLSLLIIFIPVIVSLFVKTKIYTKLEDKSAPQRRETNYYESCCVSRTYYKETRMLGAFGYFYDLYQNSLASVQKLRWKSNVRYTIVELGLRLFSLLGYLVIFYMVFVNTLSGDISIGAFVAIVNSIASLFTEMELIIIRNLGNVSADFGKVMNYVNLLEMEESHGEDVWISKACDINLQHISFTYPNSAEKAIDDISFTIKNGETLAIVGENGAGKSTLVKLITGLYKPDSGAIYFDNMDTRFLSTRSNFLDESGIFQKYQRYPLSLGDNIAIGEFDKKKDDVELRKVCEMSDVDLDNKFLQDGLNTVLSVEFGGIDLSGGQWQRIAIARGFYRDGSLIVLDEPTAAIDPLEERALYDHFAEISKDKTTIIVTHRLGSVRLADRVVMMQKGKIIGIGEHDSLYKTCKEYAELWDSQSTLYV